MLIWTKNDLGHILGDSFTNSSSHPAFGVGSPKNVDQEERVCAHMSRKHPWQSKHLKPIYVHTYVKHVSNKRLAASRGVAQD
jgi:hypothetical protein